jgi:hypothetical protein
MIGEIIKRFEANGFKLVAMKHIYATKEQLEVRIEDRFVKYKNLTESLSWLERSTILRQIHWVHVQWTGCANDLGRTECSENGKTNVGWKKCAIVQEGNYSWWFECRYKRQQGEQLSRWEQNNEIKKIIIL